VSSLPHLRFKRDPKGPGHVKGLAVLFDVMDTQMLAFRVHIEPLTERKVFFDFLQHGFQAAGAVSNILADSAGELLFRASRGVPRAAAHLLREALMEAHQQDKNFIDDAVLETVLDQQGSLQ